MVTKMIELVATQGAKQIEAAGCADMLMIPTGREFGGNSIWLQIRAGVASPHHEAYLFRDWYASTLLR